MHAWRRTFHRCRAVNPVDQYFTIDECRPGQVINIQSAVAGYSVSYNPTTNQPQCPWRNCTRSINEPLTLCNGRRSCRISQTILIYPRGSVGFLCPLQRDGNFITIRFTCVTGTIFCIVFSITISAKGGNVFHFCLFVYLSVCLLTWLLKKLSIDFHEIWWVDMVCTKDRTIRFCDWSGLGYTSWVNSFHFLKHWEERRRLRWFSQCAENVYQTTCDSVGIYTTKTRLIEQVTIITMSVPCKIDRTCSM